MHLTLNENHVKTPLTDDCVPRYAMNHPIDLLTALRYNDNNVYIDEAILSTWKSNAVIEHFRTIFKKIIPKDL